jgi:protein phosphatase
MPIVNTNGVDKTMAGAPRRLICQNLEAAYASDVGMVRDNNEDSIAAFLGMVPRSENGQELLFGFFAVADGMGGYENGEVASNIAVRVTQHGVLSQFYQRSLQGLRPGTTGQMPGDVILQIIEEANQAIVRESLANRKNMGTTLTCITLIGSMAFIGHIGDSRLYGIEKESGELRQLSKDHSLVARLVETGALTEQEAADSPQRSVLYRSLGQRPDTPADADFVRTTDYTYLLLCSDGLWDMLPDSTIQYFIKKYQDPATICQELIKTANEAGGVDNISVIVIKL